MNSRGKSKWNQFTREASEARRAAGIHHEEGSNRLSADDIKRLRRAFPADTRDLTARFFGDPLPGRSALDQKRRAQA